MKAKAQRLIEIKNIISSEKISNQEELLHKLEIKGYNYTQATLSRDLKLLKVSKVVDEEKGYIYQMPLGSAGIIDEISQNSFPLSGFKNIRFSNNLGVIKTLPGYAPSIASLIDNLGLFEILGTIAGDDTILIIPNDGVSKQDIINLFLVTFPQLKDKL